MSEPTTSEPTDPVRWAESGGPPGSLELVRSIERTPALPPDLRGLVRRRLRRRARRGATRLVGGVAAAAFVIGGLALWTWPRAGERLRIAAEPPPATEPPAAALVPPPPVHPPPVHPPPVHPPPVALPAGARGAPEPPMAPPIVVPGAPCPPMRQAHGESDPAEALPARARAVAPRGAGALTVMSVPWARLFVDGRDTGRTTPVRGMSLAAGMHRLGLRTADGVMHEIPVEIRTGETTRIVRQF